MTDLLNPPSTGVPAVESRTTPRQYMDFTPVWLKWFVDLTQVINKSGGLAGSIPASRKINTTLPLTGGGALSNDLTISFGNQAAKQFLAGPSSGSGAPTFRAIVVSDLPGTTVNVTIPKLTSGGSAGQLQFTNGLLTGVTQPT